MSFSNIIEARHKARKGMIEALDNYLDGKVDEHEFKVIIHDYEALVSKAQEDDNATIPSDN
jgi:hypothetical protein